MAFSCFGNAASFCCFTKSFSPSNRRIFAFCFVLVSGLLSLTEYRAGECRHVLRLNTVTDILDLTSRFPLWRRRTSEIISTQLRRSQLKPATQNHTKQSYYIWKPWPRLGTEAGFPRRLKRQMNRWIRSPAAEHCERWSHLEWSQ